MTLSWPRYADYKPVPPPKTAVYKPVPPPKPKPYPNAPTSPAAFPAGANGGPGSSSSEGNYMNSGQTKVMGLMNGNSDYARSNGGGGYASGSYHQQQQPPYASMDNGYSSYGKPAPPGSAAKPGGRTGHYHSSGNGNGNPTSPYQRGNASANGYKEDSESNGFDSGQGSSLDREFQGQQQQVNGGSYNRYAHPPGPTGSQQQQQQQFYYNLPGQSQDPQSLPPHQV